MAGIEATRIHDGLLNVIQRQNEDRGNKERNRLLVHAIADELERLDGSSFPKKKFLKLCGYAEDYECGWYVRRKPIVGFLGDFDECNRRVIQWLKLRENRKGIREDLAEEICELAEAINLASSPYKTKVGGITYFVQKRS